MTPQLILTLDPETGALCAELPGQQATRRKVMLRTSEAGETLLRILNAQLQDRSEIGLDGAPTQAQVLHWERHGIWPSAQCRFCLAEGRAKKSPSDTRKAYTVSRGSDGVEVRRLPAGKSFRHKTLDTKRSPGDLDL